MTASTPRRAAASLGVFRAGALAGLVASLGCAATGDGAPTESHEFWASLAPHIRILEAGRESSRAALVARARRADAVVIGETHTDETTHDLELAILDAVTRASTRQVILALEMFARDVQPALDAYLANEIDEASFLARSRPWGNYRTGYRPLVEFAKAHELRVVASNIPTAIRRKISKGKEAAWNRLTPDERRHVPPTLISNSRAYWDQYDRLAAGHLVGEDAPPLTERLYWSQSLWDNTMAWSSAEALDNSPGALLVHVNGSFHSRRSLGLVEQLRARKPGLQTCVVTIVPCLEPSAVSTESVADLGDFVILARRRGAGLHEGWHSVTTPTQVRFRIIQRPSNVTRKTPLVIRLGDTPDVSATEALVVEIESVRPWCREPTFERDIESWSHSISEVIRYVRQSERLDAARPRLVARGRAATVLSAFSLAANSPAHEAWAVDPEQYTRVGFATLPTKNAVRARLRVAPKPQDRRWWQQLLAKYRNIGADAELIDARLVAPELRGQR